MPSYTSRHAAASALRPVLELARKYVVPSVGATIRRKLEALFPTHLDDWDDLQAKLRTERENNGVSAIEVYPEPASVARLAADFDFRYVQAVALYHLAVMAPSGLYFDDALELHLSDNSPDFNPAGTRTARWNILTAEDLLKIRQGREYCQQYIFSYVEEDLIDSPDCYGLQDQYTRRHKVDAETCENTLSYSVERMAADIRLHADVMTVLGDELERFRVSRVGEVCRACRNHAQDTLRGAREHVWDSLLEIFELDCEMEEDASNDDEDSN